MMAEFSGEQESKRRLSAKLAHALIRAYQLSLSGLTGRQCRHLPTCSNFMDEAISRHGFWPGGWMGFARLCRCQPWGTSGYDPAPVALRAGSRWDRPWRYGQWRGPLACEAAEAQSCPTSVATRQLAPQIKA